MTETPRPDPWAQVRTFDVSTYGDCRMERDYYGDITSEQTHQRGEYAWVDEVDAARAADVARHQQEIAKLEQERDRLKADQQDWRKGVALIASALGDPADNLSCVRIAEIGLTLRANLETADEQLVRLKEQARSISVRLTDAGIGPMTIPEGVTALVHRAEAAEARCARLAAALEAVLKSANPHPVQHPAMFSAWQIGAHALAAAPQGGTPDVEV